MEDFEDSDLERARCPQCGEYSLVLQIEGADSDAIMDRMHNPLGTSWENLFESLGRQVWVCEACGFRDEISGGIGG